VGMREGLRVEEEGSGVGTQSRVCDLSRCPPFVHGRAEIREFTSGCYLRIPCFPLVPLTPPSSRRSAVTIWVLSLATLAVIIGLNDK